MKLNISSNNIAIRKAGEVVFYYLLKYGCVNKYNIDDYSECLKQIDNVNIDIIEQDWEIYPNTFNFMGSLIYVLIYLAAVASEYLLFKPKQEYFIIGHNYYKKAFDIHTSVYGHYNDLMDIDEIKIACKLVVDKDYQFVESNIMKYYEFVLAVYNNLLENKILTVKDIDLIASNYINIGNGT